MHAWMTAIRRHDRHPSQWVSAWEARWLPWNAFPYRHSLGSVVHSEAFTFWPSYTVVAMRPARNSTSRMRASAFYTNSSRDAWQLHFAFNFTFLSILVLFHLTHAVAEPVNCLAGSYAVGSSCALCPAGTYNPSNGSTSASACLLCPAGTYQPMSGSSSALDCTACPAGRYCLSGCASLSGSGVCAVGTFSSLGNGTSPSCSLCPSNFYCSGQNQPKFAAFFRDESSVVYYPNISNPISTRPTLNSNPISLLFEAGTYVNLGTVQLQPSQTGFSATLVAKYSGGQRDWSRLWEFGGSPWSLNIILSRFGTSNLVRFESFQRYQGLNGEITANNGWSSTGEFSWYIVTVWQCVCSKHSA